MLLTVIALGAAAIPVLNMRLGLPDDSTAAPSETNRQAYDLLTEGFGPGFNGPLTIVVDAARGGSAQQAANAVAAEFRGHADVAAIGRPTLNEAGDTAIISLTPSSGPSTEATKDLVADIRDRAGALDRELDAEVLVTGATATNIDVSDRMGAALVPYLAVIVGLAMLLLMIAFRSVLVPLTALGGFLLTIGAAFGMTVLVFQEGFAAGLFGVEQAAPIISLLPVLIIGILFGLAMDYQVFLVSRMREEHVHGADPDTAVKEGFRHGARVVTAAALIMGAVFSGFILEDDAIIKSIGFALAFGILVDAFVVRMTLIPALMSLLGKRAWWLPRWLDRALPRVDIEGETLRTERGTPAAPPPRRPRSRRPAPPAARPSGRCRRRASRAAAHTLAATSASRSPRWAAPARSRAEAWRSVIGSSCVRTDFAAHQRVEVAHHVQRANAPRARPAPARRRARAPAPARRAAPARRTAPRGARPASAARGGRAAAAPAGRARGRRAAAARARTTSGQSSCSSVSAVSASGHGPSACGPAAAIRRVSARPRSGSPATTITVAASSGIVVGGSSAGA